MRASAAGHGGKRTATARALGRRGARPILAGADRLRYISRSWRTRRLRPRVPFAFWGTAMSNLMNTYARLPIAFARGEGVWLWDESGKRYLDALSGIAVCGLGHAHPRLAQGAGRAGRDADPHLEPLSHHASGRARGEALPGVGHGSRVLLQLRRGSERGRDQARAPLRPSEGDRSAHGHRDGAELPRPHHGHADRHRIAQGPGGIRAAPHGLRPRAVQRFRGGPAGGRAQQEHRRDARGADPGRRRHRGAGPGVPLEAACDLRRAGLAPHAGRGADRNRPHRSLVRVPARGHPARRDEPGQGTGVGRPDRRLRRVRSGCRRLQDPATTAPPSAAIRSPARRASRRSRP